MSAAIATLPIPCNHTPATDSAPLLVIYSAPLHISHLQIFFAFPDPLSSLESFPSPKSKENLGGAEIVQSRRPRLFNLGVGFRVTRTQHEPARPARKSATPARKSAKPARKSAMPARKSADPARKSATPARKSEEISKADSARADGTRPLLRLGLAWLWRCVCVLRSVRGAHVQVRARCAQWRCAGCVCHR